ncbi:hypothetical protein mRhiFer1_009196 [Rhinolophus ferrumequinum]|uniref:Uncharacterized protein n=1 Tax=Rhinolophus ferrumequinum TaxID=59479 RepID=A0A7J7SJG5_RHIFE|nr:hypothetical protein mRhiFer1_009196 [Rhinolophus ferrumequinum]
MDSVLGLRRERDPVPQGVQSSPPAQKAVHRLPVSGDQKRQGEGTVQNPKAQVSLGFPQSGTGKSSLHTMPSPLQTQDATRSGRLSSLRVSSINAVFPLLPSLSPGLLRFLSLFHKQNKNQIKRLNVCREITCREQTQNGGRCGEHELDQLKGSPPPYIKPHFRM